MNTELQYFIDNYSNKDFDKIKFDWNGMHSDELVDANYKFRKQLIDIILPQIGTVNLELIKDIYLELSKFAKEGWGVPSHFRTFAQELINRDYRKYLLDYLEGASKSMDTTLDTARIVISKQLAKEIFDYINERLKDEKDERNRILLEVIGRERFQFLSTNEK